MRAPHLLTTALALALTACGTTPTTQNTPTARTGPLRAQALSVIPAQLIPETEPGRLFRVAIADGNIHTLIQTAQYPNYAIRTYHLNPTDQTWTTQVTPLPAGTTIPSNDAYLHGHGRTLILPIESLSTRQIALLILRGDGSGTLRTEAVIPMHGYLRRLTLSENRVLIATDTVRGVWARSTDDQGAPHWTQRAIPYIEGMPYNMGIAQISEHLLALRTNNPAQILLFQDNGTEWTPLRAITLPAPFTVSATGLSDQHLAIYAGIYNPDTGYSEERLFVYSAAQNWAPAVLHTDTSNTTGFYWSDIRVGTNRIMIGYVDENGDTLRGYTTSGNGWEHTTTITGNRLGSEFAMGDDRMAAWDYGHSTPMGGGQSMNGGIFQAALPPANVPVPDTTPPALTLPASPVTAKATSPAGAAFTYAASAQDDRDGPLPTTCTPESGSTFAPGKTTVTCEATDAAGNTAQGTFDVQVTYTFGGFLSPVDNLPVMNTVKAGSAVPVKFTLAGQTTLDVLAPGYPKVTAAPCTAAAPVDEIEVTAPATSTSGLTYQDGVYTYVWKTGKQTGCYQLNVRTKDGADHYALFKLR